MIRESLISLAFRQFATMVAIDEVPEQLNHRDQLKVYFARLPWDEKAFKVSDDRVTGADTDGSAGNWMARVSKDGPCLILSPTMDVYSKRIIVGGAQFWKRLSAALDRGTDDAVAGRRPDADAETLAPLALNRWNKFHFAKWTQEPAKSQSDKRAEDRAGKPSLARQAYSIFYQ